MAKRRRSKYSGFKNFEKTYQRYVRDYYRKARKLYIKEKSKDPDVDLVKRGRGLYIKTDDKEIKVTKKMMRTAMADQKVLPREKFAEYYKSTKKELEEQESTSDPTQYLVAKAAYRFSIEQYRGFKKAMKESYFEEATGVEIDKITLEEFRTGKWQTEEFFESVKAYYHEVKAEGEALGLEGKELTQFVTREVASLYFGSE